MTNSPTRKRYLILGANRSGTTYINKALADHPQIAGAPREFSVWPLLVAGTNAFLKGNRPFGQCRDSTRLLFDLICDIDKHPDARAAGGKIAVYEEVEAMDVVCGVREYFEDLVIVRVHRDDQLSRFASLKAAEQSDRWWLQPGATRSMQRQRLDPETFRVFLEVDRAKASVFDALYRTHEVVDVHFDTLPDPEWITPVHEALGVDPIAPPVSRRSTPPLDTWVDNLDELRELIDRQPPRRNMEGEIEQHRRQARMRGKPYEILSRAHYLTRVGDPWRARNAVMPAFWRHLEPDQLAEACSLLLSAVDTIGSSKLAATSLHELPKALRETPPALALRAYIEAKHGDTRRALELLQQAQQPGLDGNTARFVNEVAEHVRSSQHTSATLPGAGIRRFVVVTEPACDAARLVDSLAAHPDIVMHSDALRPWPLLRRGMNTFAHRPTTEAERQRLVRVAFDALAPWQNGLLGRGLHVEVRNEHDALDAVAGLRENLPGALIIHVVRDDLVARFAEEQSVMATAKQPATIDSAAFTAFATEKRRVAACLQQLGDSHDVVTVTHDDIVAWPGFAEICTRLELSQPELSQQHCAAGRAPSAAIANHRELAAIAAALEIPDMAAAVREHMKTTSRPDLLRDPIHAAEQLALDGRLLDAGRTVVTALRREEAAGSPAAAIGFDLLADIWRRRNDPEQDRAELAELAKVHAEADLQQLRALADQAAQ